VRRNRLFLLDFKIDNYSTDQSINMYSTYTSDNRPVDVCTSDIRESNDWEPKEDPSIRSECSYRSHRVHLAKQEQSTQGKDLLTAHDHKLT